MMQSVIGTTVLIVIGLVIFYVAWTVYMDAKKNGMPDIKRVFGRIGIDLTEGIESFIDSGTPIIILLAEAGLLYFEALNFANIHSFREGSLGTGILISVVAAVTGIGAAKEWRIMYERRTNIKPQLKPKNLKELGWDDFDITAVNNLLKNKQRKSLMIAVTFTIFSIAAHMVITIACYITLDNHQVYANLVQQGVIESGNIETLTETQYFGQPIKLITVILAVLGILLDALLGIQSKSIIEEPDKYDTKKTQEHKFRVWAYRIKKEDPEDDKNDDEEKDSSGEDFELPNRDVLQDALDEYKARVDNASLNLEFKQISSSTMDAIFRDIIDAASQSELSENGEVDGYKLSDLTKLYNKLDVTTKRSVKQRIRTLYDEAHKSYNAYAVELDFHENTVEEVEESIAKEKKERARKSLLAGSERIEDLEDKEAALTDTTLNLIDTLAKAIGQ